ncbi:MAG: carboxypeptidase-like regulatory domain-containing protein [Terriglobia bacterium]
MKPQPSNALPGATRRRGRRAALWLAAFVVAGLAPFGLPAQESAATPGAQTTTGWVCGMVVDETFAFVAEAELALTPGVDPGGAEPEPVARATTDAHGSFCLRDLPPGFYQLRAAKAPWPPQPERRVEVRAGLVNRLTAIELELEPGEPRVSFAESFDGMPPGQARALMERLIIQNTTASIQELARRLLPKRGVRIDVGRLAGRLKVSPLVEELLRQLEEGYLPPLKTARYVYVVGELADPRTHDATVQGLLRKLGDGRRLPPAPFLSPGRTPYVGDIAIQALARLTGKDFGWKYGQSPLRNQAAIRRARTWWRSEVESRERFKGRGRR